MKRVLCDHNVARPLRRLLTMFDAHAAAEYGWDRFSNGKLLSAAESGGFEVLLTGDKSMRDEQKIVGRKIGLAVMSANDWRLVRDHVDAIIEAVETVKPGEVLPVFCGRFVPRKFRTPR